MRISRFLLPALLVSLLAGCATRPSSEVPVSPADPPKPVARPVLQPVPPRIALVLGGGGVRGFAHVGVIKSLEAQGIRPDIIVGTSAGSFVGALYAGGYNAADLQRVAANLDEAIVADWTLPDRGVLKGEALQNFVNRAVLDRPIEKLNRFLAVVATDLQSGEQVVFRRGNTGMAVRASSSVPGVFQPVSINGRDYVDGGLTSPVPVRVARGLGADIVIAVDVSNKPRYGKVSGTIDVLLQTFAIMGQAIAAAELPEADVVIRPDTSRVGLTDFAARLSVIQEGEKAAAAAIAELRKRIAEKTIWVEKPN